MDKLCCSTENSSIDHLGSWSQRTMQTELTQERENEHLDTSMALSGLRPQASDPVIYYCHRNRIALRRFNGRKDRKLRAWVKSNWNGVEARLCNSDDTKNGTKFRDESVEKISTNSACWIPSRVMQTWRLTPLRSHFCSLEFMDGWANALFSLFGNSDSGQEFGRVFRGCFRRSYTLASFGGGCVSWFQSQRTDRYAKDTTNPNDDV